MVVDVIKLRHQPSGLVQQLISAAATKLAKPFTSSVGSSDD